jgi:hypothetical protein
VALAARVVAMPASQFRETMTSDVTLDQWVGYVFDHPVADPAWHFAVDSPYLELRPERTAELIAQTFEEGRLLLQPFSNEQLNQAFWFLLNSGNSDYMFSLTDASVPWPVTRRALRSFVPLFREVMAARCSPSLSHLDESGATALNSACYMWWDLMPISEASAVGDSRKRPVHDEVLAVLAELLEIPHDACRESALHGLGHWALFNPGAAAVIDEFLGRSTGLRRELLNYARQARAGCIL